MLTHSALQRISDLSHDVSKLRRQHDKLPGVLLVHSVCIRHGFDRSSGWIFALVLCLVRIVGACCQLTTYHNQSVGLLEATIILESIGISPLLLATLGLLSRW